MLALFAALFAALSAFLVPAHGADKSMTPAEKPSADGPAASALPYQKVEQVFKGNTTIAGEKIVFPSEESGVTALVITMSPGEETDWHQHGTPLFAYILEGDLTVTYEGLGERHYGAGTGLLEAMQVTHRGRNSGDGPVRILAVFLTGKGTVPTLPEAAPK